MKALYHMQRYSKYFIIIFFGIISSAQADLTISIGELNLQSNSNYNMKWGVEGRVITSPHWTSEGKSEPVFYPMDRSINVDAKFDLSESWDSSQHTVWVKATNGTTDTIETSALLNYGDWYFTIETSTWQNAGSWTNNKIGNVGLEFFWYYSLDGMQTWNYAGYTINSCYIVFNGPLSLWSTNGIDNIPVYVEMMDAACMAMEDAATVSEAIDKLTISIYGWMTYDGNIHYTFPSYTNLFYIKEWTEDSKYDHGPKEGNDCRDFSVVYKILAATIGINVECVLFTPQIPPSFQVRWIKPSDLSPSNNYLWEYHLFNSKFEGILTWDDKALDSSLKLDSDANDANGWTNPGLLPNNDIRLYNYKVRLSNADVDAAPIALLPVDLTESDRP